MNWGYIGTKLATGLGLAAGKKVIGEYGKSWGFKKGGRGYAPHRYKKPHIMPGYRRRYKKPYSRRRRYRPKLYGRQRGRMRVSGYYGRYNRGQPTSEWKFHDLSVVDVVVASAGSITTPSCNTIAQGTDQDERIGRKCTIKSIEFRYSILLPTTVNVGDGSDEMRLIIYLDKQCNGETAIVGDILESADFQSFYNLANQNRFNILLDKTLLINALAGSGNGSSSDTFDCTRAFTWGKRCNIPIEFDATTGGIAEIRSNNIGILMISRKQLIGFEGFMRLRFTG